MELLDVCGNGHTDISVESTAVPSRNSRHSNGGAVDSKVGK